MKKLEGKIAIITGGSSGIGFSTTQLFVEEGAYVFITGRRQTELDEAVKQIGENVTGIQGDMSNLADLDRLYAIVKQQKGQIDILFANAGTGEFLPLEQIRQTSEDLALMYEWFERIGTGVDVGSLHKQYPEVNWLTFKDWVKSQN
jgi:NAD(P)-dependent dehydrogenase (short-subunit alcohol dehydrogenase family)